MRFNGPGISDGNKIQQGQHHNECPVNVEHLSVFSGNSGEVNVILRFKPRTKRITVVLRITSTDKRPRRSTCGS